MKEEFAKATLRAALEAAYEAQNSDVYNYLCDFIVQMGWESDFDMTLDSEG